MALKGKIVMSNSIGGRFELEPFQSPRGARLFGELPTSIRIDLNRSFDYLEFTSLIEWLGALQMSMGVKTDAPIFPTDRIQNF